jgi:hypothetical protein
MGGTAVEHSNSREKKKVDAGGRKALAAILGIREVGHLTPCFDLRATIGGSSGFFSNVSVSKIEVAYLYPTFGPLVSSLSSSRKVTRMTQQKLAVVHKLSTKYTVHYNLQIEQRIYTKQKGGQMPKCPAWPSQPVISCHSAIPNGVSSKKPRKGYSRT